MSELELLTQISEKLDILNDRLEAIIIILLVYTIIHYYEKWLKIGMSKI